MIRRWTPRLEHATTLLTMLLLQNGIYLWEKCSDFTEILLNSEFATSIGMSVKFMKYDPLERSGTK
jgi:hypothetical protein